MAKAKLEKRLPGIPMDIIECPVCFETMSAPIYQCQSGHSFCASCTKSFLPPICPCCRQPMTQTRNFKLEEIITSRIPCPNKHLGCKYNLPSHNMDNHVKECIFRMTCPVGAIFGKCSWTGHRKEIMDHVKEYHPENCDITTDTEVELNNISIQEDKWFVYLVPQGSLLFIVTMKINVLQNVTYWVVQLIGSKKIAQQHIYEIHVTSKQDKTRKVIFIDECFNNSITAYDIYNLGKCAILPLKLFSQFIIDFKFSFKFYIKRISTDQPKGSRCVRQNNRRHKNVAPNAGI